MYDKENYFKKRKARMITSIQNNQVKKWKRLHQRKHRERQEQFLIEGFHLIEEALDSHWIVEHIIVQDEADLPAKVDKRDVTFVSKHVFEHLSQTKTSQGIIGVIKRKSFAEVKGERILLIDGIQDPGNLGTIVRTAVAAGYDGIVLGDGTVDLFNDKAIRATQGAFFHLPFMRQNLHETILALKQEQFTIVASALEGAMDIQDAPKLHKFALILGNEGAGIQEKLLEKSDFKVKIPLYGKAESLNVSVAAGIFMYMLQ